MTQILYFCKDCGHRLSPEDTQIALKLGEDVQTVCCSTCRKLLAPIAEAAVSPAPAPVPTRRANTEVRRPARFLKTDRRFPLVPFLSGMAAVGVVLAVFVAGSKSKTSAEPVARRELDEPIKTKKVEVAQAAEPSRASPVMPAQVVRKDVRDEPVKPTAAAAPSNAQGYDLDSGAALIESLLRQRSFLQAMERVAVLEQNAGSAQPWTEKVNAWRSQAKSGSQALLEELIRSAEQRADAGDARGVQAVLGARPLLDLLPEHAQSATQKAAELAARGEERAKAVQAERDAQTAQLRANFESTLPTEAELGASPGGKILFGPGAKDAQFEAGRESVRSVADRAAYIDGTQKVALSHASNLGMIQAGNDVCVEYSAAQDVQVYVKVSGDKDVGGVVTLPAGKLQRKTIAVDNKRASSDGLLLNFKGHWAGRSFKRVHLEFKNCPPGSVAVFRVSVK